VSLRSKEANEHPVVDIGMRHAVVPALGDDLRARWTAWLADCSRVLKARRNKRTKRMTKNSRLSRLFFNYLNPHPSMKFDCTVKDGNVEHWDSELLTFCDGGPSGPKVCGVVGNGASVMRERCAGRQ
jgi:hypothetical protein